MRQGTSPESLEACGVDVIVSGVGWHEARVPTIATSVPRAAFAGFTRAVSESVTIPVAASNRINTPQTAEHLLSAGDAALVSLARPFLADPAFLAKARSGNADAINTCIGCNQACIDHTLAGDVTSCLVNPRAGHETLLMLSRTRSASTVAVVGAGPAGLAAATAAAECGHRVTLFEAMGDIGGQFDLARRIPGKEEFSQTLRYFRGELARLGVEVRTRTRATAQDLIDSGFDEIILATGVTPRLPAIDGVDHPHVADYASVIRGDATAGDRVVILGAGGIGFDTAAFLTQDEAPASADRNRFFSQWGVSVDPKVRGGLVAPRRSASRRSIVVLQRKPSKPGAGLGLTTGWIHRTELRHRGVTFHAGVAYDQITDAGIHVTIDGDRHHIDADTIVLCTGQISVDQLDTELRSLGADPVLVGGARLAGELDAKRAIREGTEAATRIVARSRHRSPS